MRIFSWSKKELESFEYSHKSELDRMDSQEERERFEADYRIAIAGLKNANKRFFGALVFALVATAYMLIYGLSYSIASAIMLLLAPHMIGGVLAYDKNLSLRFPLRSIRAKTTKREAFASAVWCIAFCLAPAAGIYHW